MSKRTWDRLSDADRKLVQEAAAEATALQRKMSKESDDVLVADLKAKGIQIDNPDKGALSRRLLPVGEQMRPARSGRLSNRWSRLLAQ